MIGELHVRGLAVLDQVGIEFSPRFNVVTGETGAGKTLLLTCLDLLAGARNTGRNPAADQKLEIEAVIHPNAGTLAVLEAAGIELTDGELVVSRTIGSDGRSRARVGGSLVPLNTLADVMGTVLEIHGQGGGFALARSSAQRAALDAFGGTTDLREQVAGVYSKLQGLRKRRSEIAAKRDERLRRADYLRFVVTEIEGVEESLLKHDSTMETVSVLRNAASVTELLGTAAAALSDNAGPAAGEAVAALRTVMRMDPSATEILARVEGLANELDEIAAELSRRVDALGVEVDSLTTLEDELAELNKILRKYGGDVPRTMTLLQESRDELSTLDSDAESEDSLTERIDALEGSYNELAAKLGVDRRAAAKKLSKAVSGELASLALGRATFRVEVSEAEPGPHGKDLVEFKFTSDPSIPEANLGLAASGGELSRLMIALKLALADVSGASTLVFDEADSGVGGAAALDLGVRLGRLGDKSQVLVVTHLPQVAAFADTHFVIERTGSESKLRCIVDSDRVEEVSRMLAGISDSGSAQEHAKELLAKGSRT